MILFYILLSLLIISRLKYSHQGFYSDYLSFDTTNAVKGIFIALVFIKHATPYIFKSSYVFDDSILSRAFLFVNAEVGQWIVAMFLFYSGFGIMESIKKKGISYVHSIPRKRILTTLVNFDIAVVIFAVIALLLHNDYSLMVYLLSLTGWESIGNSNWYIFIIMLCYLMVFLCFRSENKDGSQHSYMMRAVICFCLLGVLVFALSRVKPSWWYDTMLCFGIGIFYSLWLEQIEIVLQKYYWLILFILTIMVVCLRSSFVGVAYNVYCIIFCILVVMLTMKFKINNLGLIWSGKNIFPLYIYQRVPMIILSSISGGVFVSSYPILYTLTCLLITVLLAHFYKYWVVRL